MTIMFGTETVRKFDRLEAMPNRTVGVAKLCRHRLTGKEGSRNPAPAGRFDHGFNSYRWRPFGSRRPSARDPAVARCSPMP
jgi:hypothetical protein